MKFRLVLYLVFFKLYEIITSITIHENLEVEKNSIKLKIKVKPCSLFFPENAKVIFEILFPSNYFAGKIIKMIKCYEYEIFVR